MLGKILQIAKKTNSKNIESFRVFENLRCENIFETFLNVTSFNRLQSLKKDVKHLKRTLVKPKQKLSKAERKQRRLEQKEENRNLREPFYQSIREAEQMPRRARNSEKKKISQCIFEKELELKQERGESLSQLDNIRLKNPNLREAEKFIKSKIYAAGTLNVFNMEDIKNADKEIGKGAAAEEVAKTTTMVFAGLSALKYVKTQLNNAVTTLSIYVPGGRFLKFLSFPLAILVSLNVKPIMDGLWKTEYEKIKQN